MQNVCSFRCCEERAKFMPTYENWSVTFMNGNKHETKRVSHQTPGLGPLRVWGMDG